MKQIAIICLFLCSIGQTEAQRLDNVTLTADGRVWNVEEVYERCPSELIGDVTAVYSQKSVYGIRISGDTLIGGMAYKKLVKDIAYVERDLLFTIPANASSIEQHIRMEGGTEPCNELLREADGKVYRRMKGYDQELLLFDFTLAAGDSYEYHAVLDADTICATGGRYMRRLKFDHDVWVEGIGSLDGPLTNATFRTNDGYSVKLLSVFDGDDCIFTASDFSAPAVHGITNSIAAPQATSPSPATRYDLQGRRLNGQPVRGLYIENGRKVLTK